MRLLTLLVLCLAWTHAAHAQSIPPSPILGSTELPLGSITTVHPSPGVEYRFDQHRNSVTLYDTAPGQRAYTQRDRNGVVTSQGMLFEPLDRTPLTRPPDYEPNHSSHTPLDRGR